MKSEHQKASPQAGGEAVAGERRDRGSVISITGTVSSTPLLRFEGHWLTQAGFPSAPGPRCTPATAGSSSKPAATSRTPVRRRRGPRSAGSCAGDTFPQRRGRRQARACRSRRQARARPRLDLHSGSPPLARPSRRGLGTTSSPASRQRAAAGAWAEAHTRAGPQSSPAANLSEPGAGGARTARHQALRKELTRRRDNLASRLAPLLSQLPGRSGSAKCIP